MSTIIQGSQLREISLGRYTQGKTSTFAANGGTYQLFTVAGGEVLITGLWGKVTTAVSLDGNTLAVQLDPTTGTTVVWVTATDIGTTDTAVGDLIGFKDQGDGTTDVKVNGELLRNYLATTGEIEAVLSNETGTEVGVIEWYCTWVPLTPGATVTASA